MAYITISRQNFYHNLNQITLKTGSKEKIAIVLKDNAYGHGLKLIATLASEYGIKHAVVRDYTEAKEVKEFFESVVVLAGESRVDEVCSFAINSIEQLSGIEKGCRIELKVDTGMHRNGVALSELDEALDIITEKGLNLVGVMTHFKSADELGSDYFWQKKYFGLVKQSVKARGFESVRFHSHNSAAILRTRSFDDDMVRVGIAAYGYDELPEGFDRTDLKPVLRLYAKKVATRVLKAGQRVGYGGSYTAPRDMVVSTYNIGYGDGWLRASDKAAYRTSEGLEVLGRVSMDLISFESEKESLCIMDDAQKAAQHFGTISYEITTALSSDIPRELIE
ncbi:alanine racemase [Sulfurovum mangrovi]|uniref:alanine racemase n=1 Tax=Sulfurovum mangrovi TaxID=2893889 RepID=UPI001E2E9F9D|nr:alanine racemase [Sulfurovum mangrovi]UFH58979.1 alanine racemase [Sulfurovum mangrovi]